MSSHFAAEDTDLDTVSHWLIVVTDLHYGKENWEFELKSNSIIIIFDLREAFCSTYSVLAPKGDDSSSPWADFLGEMGEAHTGAESSAFSKHEIPYLGTEVDFLRAKLYNRFFYYEYSVHP